MLIDAGAGEKMPRSAGHLRLRVEAKPRRRRSRMPASRAEDVDDRAGDAPALRSCRRLHDAATPPAASCRAFPSARYVISAGEWEDATHPHERNRASYFDENFVPLRDAGVVDFIDGDGEVMPGVRVAHRRPHALAPDRVSRVGRQDRRLRRRSDPDHRARRRAVDHGLRPLSDGDAAFKRAFVREAIEREYLIFFEHDPHDRGRLHPRGRARTVCTSNHILSIGPSTSDTSNIEHERSDQQSASSAAVGLYDMAELTDREERTRHDAVRRSVGPLRHRHAAREARRVPGAPRRRPPAAADGAELPRQHLRHEDARRRVHPVGERGRQPEGGIQAAAPGHPRSVLRPHARGASARSSATAWSRTSASRTRSARSSATSPTTPCTAVGATVHKGGTYVCMEGPQFSTLAESKLYRSWGMDIIGMTNLQEAKLAREAEICYTTIALVTDYDCWHPDHDSVTVEMIIANLSQNAEDRAAGHRRRRVAAALRAHLRVRHRAEVRHHHPSRRRPRPGQAGSGADHRQVHEIDVDRRHRLDRVRLPDVVSGEVHRALPAGAHASRQPQLPRRLDGQAARRLRARTSPTRWRCSASGRG